MPEVHKAGRVIPFPQKSCRRAPARPSPIDSRFLEIYAGLPSNAREYVDGVIESMVKICQKVPQ